MRLTVGAEFPCPPAGLGQAGEDGETGHGIAMSLRGDLVEDEVPKIRRRIAGPTGECRAG